MTKIFISWATALSVVAVHAGSLTVSWPTSVDVEPSGSLLVVENGRHRVLRITAGRTTVLAAGLAKPFEARRTSGGTIVLSNGHVLQRLTAGRPVTLARAAEDIGPIAVSGSAVYYATETRLFRLGQSAAVADGLSRPHGVAVAKDGAVLVSDTGHGRILRVDPSTGATSTLAHLQEPRGLDVAPDGTVYVAEASSRRVLHLSPTGAQLGAVGPRFGDPYDVAVAPKGVLYVVDTAAVGRVVRVP